MTDEHRIAWSRTALAAVAVIGAGFLWNQQQAITRAGLGENEFIRRRVHGSIGALG